jgi:hypothetical protein
LIIAYVGKLIYIKKTLLQYFSESLVALFVVGGFVLVTCIVGSVAGLRNPTRSNSGSNFNGCFGATC